MSTARKKLRELLEADNFAAIQAMWDDVTTKRKETVYVHVTERQVELRSNGETGKVVKERMVRTPVEVERYPVRDAISFMQLAAAYGVGKPPEEKQVNVNVTGQIQHMTDQELEAIIEGEARELGPGE